MNSKYVFKTTNDSKIITQMFWALLPAQILSSATASFSSIINGFVIGNFLSPDALVALGFVTPITVILGALAAIISGGGRIMFGRHLGRGDKKKLNEIFNDAIVSAAIMGAVLTIIGLLFSNQIAYILGAREEFVETTSLYLKGIAIGVVPMMVVPSMMVFLQMIEKANYAFLSTIILAASNLLFGLLNVKVFNGGILGMGLASSVSQFVTLIFLAAKFVAKDSTLTFNFKQFNLVDSAKICIMGSPSALSCAFYGVRNIVLNTIAFDIAGDVAVSAMAIVGSAIGPIDAVSTGVVAVGVILASLYVGENDKKSLDKVYYSTCRVGVMISLMQIAFIVLLGKPICVLFGAEGEVLKQSYRLFLGFAATKIPYTVGSAYIDVIQSLGKIKIANIYYLLVALLGPVAFAKFLSPVWGINAVWACYVVAELIGLLILQIYYMKEKRHRKLTGELYFSGFKKNITITKMEEVVNVSQQISVFCEEHGIDQRRSYMCGLCMEEMAANEITHAIPKGCYIDIYVEVENDAITLRLRNNAKKFNPLESFSPFNPKDPCKNIGIRLVQKIAKTINYQSTFGMNVLIIEL